MKITDRDTLLSYCENFKQSFNVEADQTQRYMERNKAEEDRIGITKDMLIETFILEMASNLSFNSKVRRFIDKYYPRGDESYDIVGSHIDNQPYRE